MFELIQKELVARFYQFENPAAAATYIWDLQATAGTEIDKAPVTHSRLFYSNAKKISERIANPGSTFKRQIKPPFSSGTKPFQVSDGVIVPDWKPYEGLRNAYGTYSPTEDAFLSIAGTSSSWFQEYERQLIEDFDGGPYQNCWVYGNPSRLTPVHSHRPCIAVYSRATGIRQASNYESKEWANIVETSLSNGPKRWASF